MPFGGRLRTRRAQSRVGGGTPRGQPEMAPFSDAAGFRVSISHEKTESGGFSEVNEGRRREQALVAVRLFASRPCENAQLTRSTSCTSEMQAGSSHSAYQPKHEENNQYESQYAAEARAPVTTMSVISAAAAEKKYQYND